tara:strand:- start:13614 stop:14786 length:1173 start_codon:yes stop_codon:yes gene_type:complete
MAKNTVFISYSREDTDFMRQLKSRLEESGIKVWVDENIKGGATWDNIIEEALATSDSIIVVLSKASVASKMVMNEVSYGIEENKSVIPVMVEECKIPFRLRRIQYIDFTPGFESGIGGVLDALDRSGPQTTVKADPIVAPTVSGGPEVVTEKAIPKETSIKPNKNENLAPKKPTSETKKLLPFILGIAAIIIAAIIIIPMSMEDDADDIIDDKTRSDVVEVIEKPNNDAEVITEAQLNSEGARTAVDSIVEEPAIPEPTPKELAWEKVKKSENLNKYLEYMYIYPLSPEEQVEFDKAMEVVFPYTGYMQYSESQGNRLFNTVFPMEQKTGPPSVGDILSSSRARRIRGNSYGRPGFNEIKRISVVGERVIVKEIIKSGSAYWIKIGYIKE